MNGPHLPIDEIVDGLELDAEGEAHLASCADCQRSLDQTRRLVASARAMGPIEPPRDLWAGIEQKIRPRRAIWAFLAGGSGALVVAACAVVICGGLAWIAGDRSAVQVTQADVALEKGDFMAAQTALVGAKGPQAALRRSWLALIRGDAREAEAELEGVPDSPDREMRLALIALQKKDLDGVERHAARSERPVGWVLAAEVHLADLDDEKAREWLTKAADDQGIAGDTAREYLALLDEGSLWGTVTARWSLGLRDEAVEMAPDAVRDVEDPTRMLLWAGRAVATGHPSEALGLIDVMGAPPDGQAWRMNATIAMAQILDDPEAGFNTFAILREGGAPEEGLADAKATAAAMVKDPAVAEKLLEGVDTAAAARVRKERGLPVSWDERSPFGWFIAGK